MFCPPFLLTFLFRPGKMSSTEKLLEKEDIQSKARDDRRMAKEPFKTIVPPLNEETLNKLRGWREPNRAYILLERKYKEMTDESIHWDIMEINVESRPTSGTNKLKHYVMGKGWRVIHYGNFPKLNDTNPQRARLARIHIDPETGQSAWDALEKDVLAYMQNHDPGKQQARIDDLEQKLAAAEARAAKASKGKGKDSNDQAISA